MGVLIFQITLQNAAIDSETHVQKLLGVGDLYLDTRADIPPIPVMLDVVNVDVPTLLGLDVIDAIDLYADTITNRVVNRVVTSKPSKPTGLS